MAGMFPQRKRMRMASWDYSSSAWYFVTVCCAGRQKLLGEVVDENGIAVRDLPDTQDVSLACCSVALTDIGRTCRDVLEQAREAPSGARIVDYVVMPNHVHLIVAVQEDVEHATCLPDFVRYLKSAVTRRVRESQPGVDVWQDSYHDHVIRDDRDLDRVWDYLRNNPARWARDKYFV